MFRIALALIGNLLILASAYAEEEAPPPDPMTYYAITPDIVTNFPKSNKSKRLGFINVQVQLALRQRHSESVEKHQPVIEDALVIHISSQTEETLKSIEGREKVRTEALTIVQEVLKEETGIENMVEDLLFTKYMWQ